MHSRMNRLDYGVAEAEFLRREVSDLERVIQSLRKSRANDTQEETVTLMHHTELLRNELFDAEAEREAANQAETYALSVARSYRSFAAQGAHQLDELRSGVHGVQVRHA